MGGRWRALRSSSPSRSRNNGLYDTLAPRKTQALSRDAERVLAACLLLALRAS